MHELTAVARMVSMLVHATRANAMMAHMRTETASYGQTLTEKVPARDVAP